MAINFDDEDINFNEIDWDENDDTFDEDELSPEEIAEIKRGMQDAMMGFAYEMIDGEDGSFAFKCGKCSRVASIHERPFPHKFDCPMKRDAEKEA
jgi:hypothetical protein